MRADDLAFLSWLQVVAVAFALVAAVEWIRAVRCYQDGRTALSERLSVIVGHLVSGGGASAIAIMAFGVASFRSGSGACSDPV